MPGLSRSTTLSRSPATGATAKASSSDGQFFRSGRRRGGAGAVNAKYGPEPGLLHPPLGHARLVPHRVLSATSSEAPYVLDGLRQYRLQLIPGLRREPRWNS
ncbi:Tn3 family transposase [Phenylobacterium sp.]|uniref:Tn3 family transposase n=1 Tax=Phenylobacterium sp. TaxID=1871053 RepID=UPI0027335ED0|nr:Tn3 family transposase [Phenylobacterium sp.]MDP3592906.1 Tn3 family transposase [Phenylobacterium sp.]